MLRSQEPVLRREQRRAGAAGDLDLRVDVRDVVLHGLRGDAERRGDLLVLEVIVLRNGRTLVEIDEPHVWHFDDRGRVVKFRHAADTHGQWLAWHDHDAPQT